MSEITSAEEYRILAETVTAETRQHLRWLKGSAQVWLQILSNYPELKSEVALNKCLPDEVLEILARDSDPSVRSTIAKKRSAPENVRLLLATDSDESVRHSVALNPKTPPHIRKMLACDCCEFVSEAASSGLKKTKDK